MGITYKGNRGIKDETIRNSSRGLWDLFNPKLSPLVFLCFLLGGWRWRVARERYLLERYLNVVVNFLTKIVVFCIGSGQLIQPPSLLSLLPLPFPSVMPMR
jgi:hypothetical protein